MRLLRETLHQLPFHGLQTFGAAEFFSCALYFRTNVILSPVGHVKLVQNCDGKKAFRRLVKIIIDFIANFKRNKLSQDIVQCRTFVNTVMNLRDYI